jgi:hypothetical protein
MQLAECEQWQQLRGIFFHSWLDVFAALCMLKNGTRAVLEMNQCHEKKQISGTESLESPHDQDYVSSTWIRFLGFWFDH